jgi:CubicO group peptidase (beta-lactamase class C family)
MSKTRTRIPRWASLGAVVLALASGVTACAASPTESVRPAAVQTQPDGGVLTKEDVDAWLDGVVGSALPTTGIPGAVVSVVADGRILTARGYGLADTGTGDTPARAVDPDETLFRIGSVSKVVTATAVMQLVEQGRLDLDADVQDYLDFDLPTPRGAVTLRHLLTHTAGFEERIRGLIGAPGTAPVLRDIVSVDPPAQVFEPGTTPAYSNYGNTLAGYIVERVSGEPFEDYLQDHVFDRAGMASSSFAQPLPADLDARLAEGYPDDAQPAVPTEVVGAPPAGAMSATAPDMATFMLAHLDALPDDRRLLSPSTLDEMHSPGADAAQLGAFEHGRRMDLGFFDDSTPGLSAFGHDGDTQVFHSAMRLFPDQRAGIFISLNGDGRDGMDSYELRSAVLDGFGERYLRAGVGADDPADASSAPLASFDVDAAAATAEAAAFAGSYGTSRTPFTPPGALLGLSGQTTVAPQADGTVTVAPRPGGVGTAVYERIDTDLWREVGGSALIATRTDGGRVEAATWGASFTLLRLAPAQTAAVALPVLVVSLVVLLLSLLAWPVGALLRRRGALSAPAGTAVLRRSSPLPRRLTRAGAVAALLAVGGWTVAALAVASFQDVPLGALRAVQALQVLGALATLPAVAAVVQAVRRMRGRSGLGVVAGRLLVLAALVGVAWFALEQQLLAMSVSY